MLQRCPDVELSFNRGRAAVRCCFTGLRSFIRERVEELSVYKGDTGQGSFDQLCKFHLKAITRSLLGSLRCNGRRWFGFWRLAYGLVLSGNQENVGVQQSTLCCTKTSYCHCKHIRGTGKQKKMFFIIYRNTKKTAAIYLLYIYWNIFLNQHLAIRIGKFTLTIICNN